MSDRNPPSDDPTEGSDGDRTGDEPDSDRPAEESEPGRTADEPEPTRSTADGVGAASDRDRTSDGASRTTGAATETGPPDEPTDSTTIDRRFRSYLSGIVALFGLWIAVSPFVYQELGEAALWNNVLVGAAIFLAGGYNYYRQNNGIPTNVGVATLVALLGIWLVIAAVVLEMADGAFWSTLVSGALITILAGANAYAGRAARPVGTEREVTEGSSGR